MSKSKCTLLHWLTKYEKTSSEKGMAGFLIKKGIANGKKTANIELVLVAVIFFMLSQLIFVII